MWGTGPLAETFPDPLSVLERDLWLDPLRDGMVRALRLAGAVSAPRLARSELVTSVGGWVAVDLDAIGASPAGHRFLRKLDPRPGARRLHASWRVGRLRASLPLLAEEAVERDRRAPPRRARRPRPRRRAARAPPPRDPAVALGVARPGGAVRAARVVGRSGVGDHGRRGDGCRDGVVGARQRPCRRPRRRGHRSALAGGARAAPAPDRALAAASRRPRGASTAPEQVRRRAACRTRAAADARPLGPGAGRARRVGARASARGRGVAWRNRTCFGISRSRSSTRSCAVVRFPMSATATVRPRRRPRSSGSPTTVNRWRSWRRTARRRGV